MDVITTLYFCMAEYHLSHNVVKVDEIPGPRFDTYARFAANQNNFRRCLHVACHILLQ